MIDSLWGDEFSVKEEDISKILKKVKSPKVIKELSIEKQLKSKSVSIEEKFEIIRKDVYRTLGNYVNDTICIMNYDDFVKYVDKCIENDMCAVDTETNNTLDQIDGLLMGLCLYTPEMKNAYIPVNHRHFTVDEKNEIIIGDKIDNQITEEQIAIQLQRLLDNDTKCLFHNAAFDIGVLMSNCNVRLKAYWDSSICAKILNELENKNLKEQYKIHINPEQEKYNIEKLFKGLPYAIFEPELFALYAATDSFMTYKLYEYQLGQINLPENNEIKDLYINNELICIDSVVDMQQTGVCVDVPYAMLMSTEYHRKIDEIQSEIDEELLKLKPIIDAWRLTPEANAKQRVYPSKKTKIKEEDIPKKFPLIDEKGKHYKMSGKSPCEQLADPVELGSSTQLGILLYDIMKVGVIDNQDPRGTGADILEELSYKHNICKLILDKREVEILINTFIDKIPTLVKNRTGRVHAKFNQCGTDTGRFSSGEKDPDNPNQKSLNLQNIPSHDKCVRMIFKASPGYSIVGADYSAQEPRSTASLANDTEMLRAYDEGKDLYAVIGSKCFNNNYEDNLEFHPVTHVLQPEGKARRADAKAILLGITYGMSAKSLSLRINKSVEEAEKIINDFYKGFPGVKKLTDDSQKMLKEKGYVTDMWGRRRHLPDAQLPDYTIKPLKKSSNFNPLIGSIQHEDNALNAKIKMYQSKLDKCKWKKEIDIVVAQAKKDGLSVRNNKGFKNRAMRQCLNARIQGTAASMTKKAMGMIHNDEELRRLGFRLLVTVHDEVFGEAPTENADAAAKRLSEVMVEAAKEKCVCKFKCDPYVVKRWYEDEAVGEILKDYKKCNDLIKIKEKYPMIQEKYIEQICNETYEINTHEDI